VDVGLDGIIAPLRSYGRQKSITKPLTLSQFRVERILPLTRALTVLVVSPAH